MNKQELRSNLLLLIAAIIWGFAFVAQRMGMQFVGPFTYNGLRFALGSISLIPLLVYLKNKPKDVSCEKIKLSKVLLSGLLAGSVLFIGASLQQIGLVYTDAGKAGFITGLYIVLVPIFGMFLKHKTTINIWIGAILGVLGLYLLSVKSDFTINKGDIYVVIAAFFWTCHILLIDKLVKKIDALSLSFIQFITCSLLSLCFAIIKEKISIVAIIEGIYPILYGGLLSVGVAFTLQVIGQKRAKPSHAAIILSMEAVFAVIGGVLVLKEIIGTREYIGCFLMLIAMLASQMKFKKKIT